MRDYIYLLMTDKRSGVVASILKFFLFLFSLLYILGLKVVFTLRLLRTAHLHLDAKVISVGNLTTGGTGKTPLVEMIANFLLEKGKKVVVLTRGYKLLSKEKSDKALQPFLYEEIGDEPALLRKNLPRATILVGAGRVKNARLAIRSYSADTLILDDGFQYRQLARDIDILVIDATNPFGNGRLLPRGILREPIAGLVRADAVVITKIDAASPGQVNTVKARIKSQNPGAIIACAVHKPSRVLDFNESILQPAWLQAREFIAVCAIGDPQYFINTLKSAGAVIKDSVFFEDHHPYSLKDLIDIADRCQKASIKKVITTEKDMIKIKPALDRHQLTFKGYGLEFFALGIELDIVENKDEFLRRLLGK
jgi:tetraacyldisaccharide 4'-kinase